MTHGQDSAQRCPWSCPCSRAPGAFGLFYGAARLARHIPPLNRAIGSVLRYADDGSARLVLLTACANAVACPAPMATWGPPPRNPARPGQTPDRHRPPPAPRPKNQNPPGIPRRRARHHHAHRHRPSQPLHASRGLTATISDPSPKPAGHGTGRPRSDSRAAPMPVTLRNHNPGQPRSARNDVTNADHAEVHGIAPDLPSETAGRRHRGIARHPVTLSPLNEASLLMPADRADLVLDPASKCK